MTDEQYDGLTVYLEIISRQLDFLCQTTYLAMTHEDEDAPTWTEIALQEIYYQQEKTDET